MQDTSERQEMLNKILESKDKDEIERLIQTHYPDWLMSSTCFYSDDYAFLTDNWKKVCSLTSSQPRKIIFVNELYFNDPNYKILNQLSEFLTKNGYCIRRYNEFVLCYKCNGAIPCIELWELIKHKDNIPRVWSSHCKNCI